MKEIERYKNKREIYLTMSFIIPINTLLVPTFVFFNAKEIHTVRHLECFFYSTL